MNTNMCLSNFAGILQKGLSNFAGILQKGYPKPLGKYTHNPEDKLWNKPTVT